MGICVMALLTVVAYCPLNNFSRFLVLAIEGGVMWAFVSAFRKA